MSLLNNDNKKKDNSDVIKSDKNNILNSDNKTIDNEKMTKETISKETSNSNFNDTKKNIDSLKEDKNTISEIPAFNPNKTTNSKTDSIKDEFGEKVKKYHKLLSQVENKNVLDKMLKDKKYNLTEEINKIENFIDAEKELSSIKNEKLQDLLLNKLKSEDNNIEDIKTFIAEKKNKYLELEKNKSRIALGKTILKNIQEGKEIPDETKKVVSDIFDTSNDIAMDLGLDLSLLKTSLITTLKKDIDSNFQEEKKLEDEKSQILEKIKENLKVKEDIKTIEEKKGKLQEKLKTIDDPSEKERIQGIINKVEGILEEKKTKYTTDFQQNDILSREIKKKRIENAYKIEKHKDVEKILEKIKETNIKIEENKIEPELKSVFIEEYNSNKEELEKRYEEKIENERNIRLDSIKDKIEIKSEDIEGFKKVMEKEGMEEAQDTYERKIKLEKELDKINAGIECDTDIEINDNDDFQTKMEKKLKQKSRILTGGVEKLKLKKDALQEENNTKEILAKKKKQREITKKIQIASSNIQAKIDKIEGEYQKYMKEGNYEENKAEEYESKIQGYKELKNKLEDKNISLTDKNGLLALLGKGEWLGEYIKQREENYIYTAEHTAKTLKKYKNTNYKTLGKNKFTELYKNGLNSEKFTLIEDFAKLKAEIPNFQNVLLTDNLEKQARLLGISDDETLGKIQKLKNIQDTIKNLDMSGYTNTFLETLEEVKKGKEFEILAKEKEKEKSLREIDRLDIDDSEKDARKREIYEVADKQISEIEKEKDDIIEEISNIEQISKDKGSFSSAEIKDISNNIDLFGIVGKPEEYGDILAGISSEIIEGNTDFIDFQNAKNTKADYYTTSTLNELSAKKIQLLESNIDSIPDNASPNLKKYKRTLIEELVETQSIQDKIKKGRILEDGVIEFLSDNSLYGIKIQEDNNKILKDLQDPNIIGEDKENLKKQLAENFINLQKIKDNKINEALEEEIKKESVNFSINREQIDKELKDGFNNANNLKNTIFSKYNGLASNLLDNAKDRWDIIGSDFKDGGKVLLNEIKGNGVDPLLETKVERESRHQKIDKYLDAVFVSGFAYIFLIIPKILNASSKKIAAFPKFLDWLREQADQKRSALFGLNLFVLFMIVFFSPKNSFHFMNINTHLYTVKTYLSDTGNMLFSDTLGTTGELFYYKLNVYLFFVFLIVLYKIIIEFLHKYIVILKEPKRGMDLFMMSILKLVVFFLYMTIIFKVNSFIG